MNACRLFLILALANAANAQITCRYDVQVLPDYSCGAFGGPISPVAINNTGIVISAFLSCSTNFDSAWWNGGPAWHLLPRPPGVNSIQAIDVSDNGLIVGQIGFQVGQTTKFKGFVYSIATNQYTIIEPLAPAGEAQVSGINPSGTMICGYRSALNPGQIYGQGFVKSLTTGEITDFGLYNGGGTWAADVNDAGIVAGTVKVGGIPTPYIRQDGKLTLVGTLAGSETYPYDLSQTNDVVGWSAIPCKNCPNQGSHAFLWRNGSLVDLGVLPGTNRSWANQANSAGTVVGGSRLLIQGMPWVDHAFIWHDGIMRDLTDLLDPQLDASVGGVSGINDAGVIVCSIALAGIGKTALLTPRPLTPGDIDGNCVVNIDDLLALILDWGTNNSAADVNQDGVVNQEDLILLINNWTFY